MKKVGRRAIWLLCFLLLLGIEVLIALFVHDGFIRPYGGDIIVVILLGCLVRSICPGGKLWLSPALFVFAVAVETAQYFHIVDLIGLGHISFFRVLIGTSFAWADIWCYGVGCVLFFLADWLVYKSTSPVREKGIYILYGLACAVLTNLYLPLTNTRWWLVLLIPGLLFILIFAGIRIPDTVYKRRKICSHGATLLLAFQISSSLSILYHLLLAAICWQRDPWPVIWSGVLCIVLEALIF
jgi:hypothetical protein